jgi:hypothetical protein
LGNIHDHENNHNLLFAKIPMHGPLTCARCTSNLVCVHKCNMRGSIYNMV